MRRRPAEAAACCCLLCVSRTQSGVAITSVSVESGVSSPHTTKTGPPAAVFFAALFGCPSLSLSPAIATPPLRSRLLGRYVVRSSMSRALQAGQDHERARWGADAKTARQSNLAAETPTAKSLLLCVRELAARVM
jgi:hypothetical protein